MLGERVDSWLRGHPLLVDIGTTLALVAGCVLLGVAVRADGPYFVLSLALLLPLAVRRQRPALCAAVVVAVAFVQWLTVRDTTGALFADLAVPVAADPQRRPCVGVGDGRHRGQVVGTRTEWWRWRSG